MDQPRLARLMELLRRAEAPVRVLRHLAWPACVRARFLAGRGGLPRVRYAAFNAGPTRALTARVRKELGSADDPVAAWLGRQADAIEAGAHMLAAAGSDHFLTYSRRLYGVPTAPLPDEGATPLAFARRLDDLLDSAARADPGAPPPACHPADDLAARMQAAMTAAFGADAPRVIVVDELSANALAGPENVRIRRGACFTARDVTRLIQHEAMTHVLTSLTGRTQPHLPMLAANHPGTTRTQEGLAVFAELITGGMDLDRLRRLADRVIAIQMALDGADFVEVYRYFAGRGGDRGQAFEDARRVFRGGRVEGGIPFTKDGAYLDGLLRVHNFMRTLVTLERADLLPLLFVGKLDLEDVPALAELSARGLCRPARFLPPWAADMRFLLGQLGDSPVLDAIDLERLRAHYAELARAVPTPRA